MDFGSNVKTENNNLFMLSGDIHVVWSEFRSWMFGVCVLNKSLWGGAWDTSCKYSRVEQLRPDYTGYILYIIYRDLMDNMWCQIDSFISSMSRRRLEQEETPGYGSPSGSTVYLLCCHC